MSADVILLVCWLIGHRALTYDPNETYPYCTRCGYFFYGGDVDQEEVFRVSGGLWTAWHDLADEPFLTGTEEEAKAAARPGADDGDFVESPDGSQYGWNPAVRDWTEG